MCRTLGILLFALALLGCQKPLFENSMGRTRLSGRDARLHAAPLPADTLAQWNAPGVLALAVRFPAWAHWRDGDYRGAEAVVFKDGRELMAVSLKGDAAPDRLRLWNGRVWNDYTDGTHTHLCCNGEERLCWEGEETLSGFLIQQDSIYTLGQRADGKGLCFRVNGALRFQAPVGRVLGSSEDREWPGGALNSDGGAICYTYGISVQNGEAVLTEYRVMRGSQLIATIPAGTAECIYDIRVCEGTVYRCERRTSESRSLCLVRADTPISLGFNYSETVHGCKLVPGEGQGVWVKGFSIGRGATPCHAWLYSAYGLLHRSSDRLRAGDIFADGESMAHFTLDRGMLYQAFVDKKPLSLQAGTHELISARCAAFKDGRLALALTGAQANSHLLVLGSESWPLEFNGYLVSVNIH